MEAPEASCQKRQSRGGFRATGLSPRLWFLLLLLLALPLLAQEAAPAQQNEEGATAKKHKKSGSGKKHKNPASAKKRKDGPSAKKKEEDGGPSTLGEGEEQEEEAGKSSASTRFFLRPYPSLRFGKVLRLDLRAKAQLDFRWFKPEHQTKTESLESLFDFRRTRVTLEGRFLKDFEFEVERELREDLGEREVKFPWRNVYANYRHFRRFQIQVGKFKIPFGMDRLTGITNQDFVSRSLIGDYLAPARDIGIMVHGRFFERGLNYQVGLFKHDGEAATIKIPVSETRTEIDTTGQRTFAGRVTGNPLVLLPVPEVFKTVTLGAAFTESPVPEGLKGLRGQTVISSFNFFRHIFVRGQRLRLGTEMSWTPGPFSLKGEFIHVQEQRLGQGVHDNDLPDLISRGWYLSGSWVVTGEEKAGRVQPHKNFLFGRGIGAVELAGRYEQLRFGSAEHPGSPSRGNRAANILGNSERVWTFGVNWYLNRYIKVQADGIRETIEDPDRSPISGRTRFLTGLVRLQFVL